MEGSGIEFFLKIVIRILSNNVRNDGSTTILIIFRNSGGWVTRTKKKRPARCDLSAENNGIKHRYAFPKWNLISSNLFRTHGRSGERTSVFFFPGLFRTARPSRD